MYHAAGIKNMEIFRKMSFADSTGDAIPFYHEGKYHIFSLTPALGTTVYPDRLRTIPDIPYQMSTSRPYVTRPAKMV